MGTIIFTDKAQADKLKAKGFKCKTENKGGQTVYEFIETEELIKYLDTGFDKNKSVRRNTIFF